MSCTMFSLPINKERKHYHRGKKETVTGGEENLDSEGTVTGKNTEKILGGEKLKKLHCHRENLGTS